MKASRIYYERNQLAQARAVLEGGIAAARTMQLAHFLIDDYLALALVRQADGDGPGALAVLDEAERVLQQSRRSYWANWLIPNYRVQVLLAQGTLDQAARWMHEQAIAHNAMEPQALYIRELHDLTRARVAIALGQPEAALALLAPLLEQAVAGQRHGRVIAILALQAVALAQHGATEAALTATQRALVLAAPEGYVRAFIDVGPTMRLLLAQLRDQLVAEGSTPELSSYAAQLLAAFPHHPHAARAADTSDAAQPKAAAAMIEPLSNREREVLRFLVTGQSNQAIANALVITVGTLKVHLKNIYSKLGVHSRTEAVYRARQLALLGD
jgi:LuxR family transcriptional regulator, maltose regulon positive regulatory protein